MPDHIKIPRGSPRVQYIADGAQTVFTYGFPIFATTDLEVFLGGALQASGHRVTGAGQTVGGTVTFTTAPVAGTTVTLRRRVALERTSDFLDSGPLAAATLNKEFDVLTAGLQQVADDQALMLRYAATDLPASAELPGRTARAGRLFAFDGTGNPTVVPPVDTQALSTFTPSGSGAVSRPIADKLRDLVSVRDFGAVGDGITDDTTAFQAALTASSSVFVPTGVYRITNTITVGFGKTLAGAGNTAIIRAASAAFNVIDLPDSYAAVHHLRLENGNAGIRLFGRDGPCVQNAIHDVTIWDAQVGLLFDGYTSLDRPCYWNNVARVLVARPMHHGVRLTRTGAGDTPNANRFHCVRVYSLGAATSGSGFWVEQGKYNNAFVDCEANLSTTAHSCFRVGATSDKTLILNFYAETLGVIANVLLEAGSVETAIVNLLSMSAGPAIQDQSGGQYTAFNAGYPEKNRLKASRVSELVVEALRYDTEYIDPPAGGLIALDLTSSVYLISAYTGAMEARLPAAGSANGHAVTIKKTDATANPISITEAGGNGPDNRTVVLANRYDFVTLVSNGANWWITAANSLPGNAGYHETPGVFTPSLDQGFYAVSAYSGAVEVRLPAPAAAQAVGRTVTIKKTDPSGNTVTVTQASGAAGPDGEVIPLTQQGHALTVMSNGAAWHIIARNP
ncbi:MAG TPA: glycosyl hydrolase family 28-related protein [Azospirillaceae bacterium]|nr:glycosyl hydrolase family 28-related protein [Azospirillaceae bacterium]